MLRALGLMRCSCGTARGPGLISGREKGQVPLWRGMAGGRIKENEAGWLFMSLGPADVTLSNADRRAVAEPVPNEYCAVPRLRDVWLTAAQARPYH